MKLRTDFDLLQRPDYSSHGQFIDEGEQLSVLGKHKGFWMVQNDLGKTGWISDQQKKARRPLTVDPD